MGGREARAWQRVNDSRAETGTGAKEMRKAGRIAERKKMKEKSGSLGKVRKRGKLKEGKGRYGCVEELLKRKKNEKKGKERKRL